MEKIAQFVREKNELLRATPDLSLRTLYVVVSLCLVVSAYLLGEMHGRSSVAESQLSVSGALAYVPYDKTPLLATGNGSEKAAKNFVASVSGKLYYPADCKAAQRIKEENRIWFATVAEAKLAGLTPSSQCGR